MQPSAGLAREEFVQRIAQTGGNGPDVLLFAFGQVVQARFHRVTLLRASDRANCAFQPFLMVFTIGRNRMGDMGSPCRTLWTGSPRQPLLSNALEPHIGAREIAGKTG
ncbi:hypothetical protein GCM10007392_22410 [Saccharospirillum salsuginis]|uniref:Uncharacterized protein n=1 Tax=Saccharospirillum salsuginis TaxID=418750 RepID=A0A918KA61_9GAMM|nr:hypothetical protein GCM10007392_22410 [Saccharospirillum salsuginis]